MCVLRCLSLSASLKHCTQDMVVFEVRICRWLCRMCFGRMNCVSWRSGVLNGIPHEGAVAWLQFSSKQSGVFVFLRFLNIIHDFWETAGSLLPWLPGNYSQVWQTTTKAAVISKALLLLIRRSQSTGKDCFLKETGWCKWIGIQSKSNIDVLGDLCNCW